MKQAVMSNSKHDCHSDKLCCCGGHPSNDVKKNKHHNSTAARLAIRKLRSFIVYLKTY